MISDPDRYLLLVFDKSERFSIRGFKFAACFMQLTMRYPVWRETVEILLFVSHKMRLRIQLSHIIWLVAQSQRNTICQNTS
jgi:hypothetical protein